MRVRRLVCQDTVAALVILLVVLLFLHSAFFPLSVFISGDVGGSDFSDFFLPLKVLLGQSLKAGQLPLWAAKVGFGYPFLAEGTLQTFFPTTLLSLFFSAPLAFNLSLTITILGLAIFTYLFLRRGLKLSVMPSLLATLSFTFSAPIIMRWKHLSILGVVALFPLELLVVNRFFQNHLLTCSSKKHAGFIVGLAVLVGGQILAGHPQMALYCLVAVSLYFFAHLLGAIFSQPLSLKSFLTSSLQLFVPYLLALALGYGLGAIQLYPSLELKKLSLRSTPLTYAQSREHPFYYDYLLTLLSPFHFGDPSRLAADKEFIFPTLIWEICLYTGLITAFLGFLGLTTFFKQKKVRFWSGLFLFSVVQSAANFLYYLSGFSSFRVPSRFGILASFSLAILAAFSWERIFSRKKPSFIIGVLLILLVGGDLYYFLGTYNRTLPADKFLTPPATAEFLKNNLDSQRFFGLNGYYLYNTVYFNQRGWRDNPEQYLEVRQTLDPNSPLLWDLRAADLYTGIPLERPSHYLDALQQSFKLDSANNEITPSPLTKRLFSLGAIKYLVTPHNLVGDKDFKLVFSTPAVPGWEVKIYEYHNFLPRAYFTSEVKLVDSQVGVETELFYKGEGAPLTTVLEGVHNQPVPLEKRKENSPVMIVIDEDQKVVVKVAAKQPGYLVLSDTFCPGWRAYLEDKTEVQIVRANYNFRAVPLSVGDHIVTFVYQPEGFFRGLRVSLASLGAIFGLLVYWRLSRP